MKKIVSTVLMLCLIALSALALAEPEIVTPEEYQKNGTLPVYRAVKRDIGEGLDAALFNQSGIAKRDQYRIVFNDEAELSWAPEALFYVENKGTFDANAAERERNPEQLDAETLKKRLPADMAPLPAMSNRVADLASWASFGRPGTGETYAPEKDTLTHITLKEAEQALEKLLEKLNVQGYRPYKWLDMSVTRIHTLGESLNAAIQSGELYTNIPPFDYAAATAEDEGFYLRYERPGLERESGGGAQYSVVAFVTGRGVVYLNLRDEYMQGEMYDTPKTLIDAKTAIDALPKAIAASRYGSKLVSIEKAELSYAPMRAPDKKDGMVFSPVWCISYQDEESKGRYTCWAEFSAIDGRLVDAMFN